MPAGVRKCMESQNLVTKANIFMVKSGKGDKKV